MSFVAPGVHLQNLLLDSIPTKEEKVSCLKTLRTVMKNLADTTKNKDPKYRQLKLSNAKVNATLSPCPSALEYMKAIGFIVVVQQDDAGLVDEYLRLDKQNMRITDAGASLAELDHAITMLVPVNGEINNNRPEIVARAISAPVISSSSASNVNSSSTIPGHISEKEKARQLLEKKREREVQEAKEARRKTSNLIKQDKYVRENDDNWESKQSAACVKSGSGINTFRDKYGEN